MEELSLFLQLAWTFFLVGAFTFGGGYAMLSLIQGQVVVAHQWISESTFTDIVAISQMTPGPIGINSATYVGYSVLYEATGVHLLGVLGSAVATLSLILPSFLVVLA
ncbi:MAG: chromate transporter, partial [Bacteroidales bacterium]|nr:chromate transporter [Bacteroidales bacterium]